MILCRKSPTGHKYIYSVSLKIWVRVSCSCNFTENHPVCHAPAMIGNDDMISAKPEYKKAKVTKEEVEYFNRMIRT